MCQRACTCVYVHVCARVGSGSLTDFIPDTRSRSGGSARLGSARSLARRSADIRGTEQTNVSAAEDLKADYNPTVGDPGATLSLVFGADLQSASGCLLLIFIPQSSITGAQSVNSRCL